MRPRAATRIVWSQSGHCGGHWASAHGDVHSPGPRGSSGESSERCVASVPERHASSIAGNIAPRGDGGKRTNDSARGSGEPRSARPVPRPWDRSGPREARGVCPGWRPALLDVGGAAWGSNAGCGYRRGLLQRIAELQRECGRWHAAHHQAGMHSALCRRGQGGQSGQRPREGSCCSSGRRGAGDAA